MAKAFQKNISPMPAAPVNTSRLQRKCACSDTAEACNECGEQKSGLRRSTQSSEPQTSSSRVPSVVHEVLRSSGQPLDAPTRDFFEPRFGHDFGNVRVHTNARAAESAKAVNALAYTVGPNIVMGSKQYSNMTSAGQRILAHELAHVVQQSESQSSSSELVIGNANDAAEQEADEIAATVLGGTGAVSQTPAIHSRQGEEKLRRVEPAQPAPAPAPEAATPAPGAAATPATEPAAPATPYEQPAADRFNLCFIMGTEGPFIIADWFATNYYSGTHTIIHADSLCGVLEEIEKAVSLRDANETRRKVGQVIIISHALADGRILFPLRGDETNHWVSPDDIAKLLSPDWLERAGIECRVAALSVAQNSDAQTRVIVKGCNLGQNQGAVDALRNLFGTQATVTAPKKKVHMGYESYGPTVPGRRTAVEAVSWMVKNGYLPPSAEQWDADKKESFVKSLFENNKGIPFDALKLDEHTLILPSDPRYQENIARSAPEAEPAPALQRYPADKALPAAEMVGDQTQSGGLGEEFTEGLPPESVMEPTETLAKESSLPQGTPVIDSVELVTSSSGAEGGFDAIACDASLSQPGPYNDHWWKGTVANVHQVHFHLSQGWPGDVRATRVINRTATIAGKQDIKTGNDGPPEHEFKFTKDKLVIADAPGFCSARREDSFPSTYSADFGLYAYDPLDNKILASIAYHVDISKTSFYQIDPVNTVTVTDTKVGSAVASPVPKKN